ncbi:MAG: hypothetical protein WD627_13190 [Actinomycetota bacterium]
MKDSNVAQPNAGGSGLFHMDLTQAKSRIKQAWIFAVVSGVLSAIISVLAVSGVEGLEVFRFAMVDALILFALAYGVHRRSRAAASTLVGYWVFNIIMLGLSSAVVVRLVFLAVFILGAWATFVYHKLQGEQNTDPAPSIRDQILN